MTDASIENQIFSRCVQLGDDILKEMNEFLKIWSMTFLQYNALCVIDDLDQENTGIPSGHIKHHLYTRVPDVSRLLDRLEEKSWLRRTRDKTNRRIVRVSLTETGLSLIKSAHKPLRELEQKQFSHLSNKELSTLSQLLKKALADA